MQVVILGGSRLSFCFLDGGMIITEKYNTEIVKLATNQTRQVGGVGTAGKAANAIKRLDSVSLSLCWQAFCLSHNCWQVIVEFWKVWLKLWERLLIAQLYDLCHWDRYIDHLYLTTQIAENYRKGTWQKQDAS